MGENSVSKTGAGQPNHKILTTRDEIQALKNMDDKAKNFLNSVFGELDTSSPAGNKPDNILQAKEGEIFMFDDGTVSIMKDGKLYAGINNKGKSFTVKDGKIVYTNDNPKAQDYFDQKTKVLTRQTENGTKYEYQYDDNKKLLYSQITTKDNQRFIYSPENAKIALVNQDGSMIANIGNAASLDEVLTALGVDDAKKSVFLKSNPDAAKNGFSENSTVVIPSELAKGLDINKLVALAHRDETKAAAKPQVQQQVASEVKIKEKHQVKSDAPAEVKKAADPKISKAEAREIAKAKQRAKHEEKMLEIAKDYKTLSEALLEDTNAWHIRNRLSQKNQPTFEGLLGKPPHKYSQKTIDVGDLTITFASNSYLSENGGRETFIWEIFDIVPKNNE